MTNYIKVDGNNKPIGFPHDDSNLKQVYPNHDFSNPPTGWLEYVRNPPEPGVYQTFNESIGADIAGGCPHNGLEYKLIDGKIQEYWHYVDISDDAKKAKQDKVKAIWAEVDRTKMASWTFDEETCSYKAPVDPPSDMVSQTNRNGKIYDWDEENKKWVSLE